MQRPKIGFKKLNTEHIRRGVKPQFARWDGKEKRTPKAGEYFISGASGFEVAYLAKNDLTIEYYIATVNLGVICASFANIKLLTARRTS